MFNTTYTVTIHHNNGTETRICDTCSIDFAHIVARKTYKHWNDPHVSIPAAQRAAAVVITEHAAN